MRPTGSYYKVAFRLGRVDKIEGVSKTFTVGSETIWAVRDARFCVPSGFITGIIGESGSGKTTLLHLLGGLYRPTEGDIFYLNSREGYDKEVPLPYEDKKRMQLFQRYHVAWIFQDLNLISHLTVWQNIVLPLFLRGEPYRTEEIYPLLERLGLRNEAKKINLLNERPNQLSGGEQQRVAIARALVSRPKVILADEPTGNLDSRNRDVFLDLLLAVNRKLKITVVLVTHEINLVQKYCDAYIQCEKTDKGNICSPLEWF